MRRGHVILLLTLILILASSPVWAQDEPRVPRYAPGEILIKLRPELDGQEVKIQTDGVSTGLGSLDLLGQRHGVIGMERALFPMPGQKENARAALLAGELNRVYLLKLDQGQDIQQAVSAYQGDPDVIYAQPNYLSRLSVVPDDSLYHEQWALAKMQMPSAWDIERGSGQVIVGMVDSGIDYHHQDLADNIWINPGEDLNGNGQVDSTDFNGIDDDGNGYVDDIRGWDFTDAPQFAGLGDFWERDNDPDDDLGHGTHVSGIVAAMADNGVGVAGITWHSKLMALRAAFRMSVGAFLQDDDVAAGIVYAADNGAQVINMSWGDPHISPVIRDVIAYAHARGCVMAAAAGNVDQEGVFYPGGYDQTIAVGASTSFDQRATFSSFGRNLDVLAPGSNILSTLPNDQYGTLGGTSMATAHVSGLAALLLSKDPSLSAQEVRAIINASAVDLGPSGWDPEHGNGRIDGLRALKTERTALAQISHPETGTGLHSSVAIVGTALGAYVDGYSLDYGLGLSPTTYESILERTHSQALAETLVVWDGVGQLPDTACTIRLQVWQTEGGVVEDRVVVQVDQTPPVVDQIRAVRRLDADQYATFVEWQTDDQTLARIFYRPLGEEEFSFIDGLHVTQEHSLDLSGELEPGEYQFYLASTNPAGLTTADDNGGQYYPLSNPLEMVDRGGFLLLDQLPAGYLLDRPVDLDKDGHREILFMAFSDTSAYGQAMAYEMRPDGRLHRAFQSEADYLVWDVGDADGDGRMEILGGGYAQISLFEAPDSTSYPDSLNAVWSQEGVWGSQMADTDDDGRMEILSKVDVGSNVVVFENVEDDSFALVASLTNPTGGRNSTGTRFAVADFDGDGKKEILAGDSDGDIFIFEATGDNDYDTTWSDSTGLENALYLAPGDQLEGGGSWFVVAAKKSDVYEPRSTYWRVMVYQPTGDDEYALVWSQELVGAGSQGNGIIATDFTGDGHKEIAICALPDLYIFQRTENGEFRPIWYSSCGLMYRPFIGDLHGDGWVEIALNGPDSMVVLERADFGEAPPPPTGVVARPLDAHRVFLEWMPVPGAASYNLHRGLKYEQLNPVQTGILTTTFLDSGLVENTAYYYAVTTVDPLGRESLFYSLVVSATPNEAPRVIAAEALTGGHVGVSFSEPMGSSAQVASHYWIDGGVGSPSSVILDRTGRRALLSLSFQLEPDVLYTVEARDVSDETGVPVAADAQAATFSLPADTLPQPLYVRRAELLSRTSLDVWFSDFLDRSSAEDTSHYRIDPPLAVKEVRVDSSQQDLVHLTLAPARTRGSVYLLSVVDIWDAALQKTVIPGLGDEASFFYPATDLGDAIAVPNPFSPSRDGLLEFIKLPPGAMASIFTISGELIWDSDEAGLNGAIPWSGVNEEGQEAASGVYLYVLEAGGQVKKGKLVLLR
jgi:subtilisin family serine protease